MKDSVSLKLNRLFRNCGRAKKMNTSKIEKKCENCISYRSRTGFSDDGTCRIAPPQGYPMIVPNSIGQAEFRVFGYWPPVNKEDSCCKFVTKELENCLEA